MKARFLLPLLGLFASATSAQSEDCRLALVLAIDVSRSVDAADFALQTEGLAAALESDSVQAAFFGPAGDVALAVYQWSGESHQEMLVDWLMIRNAGDLAPVATAIRRAPMPEKKQLTALGAALDFGHDLLTQAPDCARRVIDVSGDGQNNAGPGPLLIRNRRDWQGITINALAIGDHEGGLVAYFEAQLIHGPGAFVVLARRHTDFPATIRRKMLRELTDELSSVAPREKGRKS